jgi:alpha-tubulin suppressor-like RCC1 family protein
MRSLLSLRPRLAAVAGLGLAACVDDGIDLRPGVPTETTPNLLDIDSAFGATCVVKAGGDVYCWGSEYSDFYRTGTPTKVDGIEGASRVRVSYDLGCALVGGAVRCWTFEVDHAKETPKPIDGLADDVVDLSLGQFGDLCFLHATGRVSCSIYTFADWEVHLVDIAGVEDLVALSRGGFCGIRRDRSLQCWSRIGDTIQPPVIMDVPPIRSVAGRGGYATYEALADDGVIWGFTPQPGGVFTKPTPLVTIPDAVEIVNNVYASCARTDRGEVYCSRTETNGEAPVRSTPERVDVDGVTLMSVGLAHACATDSVSLWCWGSNETGQLGLGFQGEKELVEAKTVVEGAARVAAGDRSSCAATEAGVTCWGANEYGQLGTGDRVDRRTPADGPRLTDVVELVMGWDSACALHRSGTVSCWGNNQAGQLGGERSEWRGSAEPVPGVDRAIALSMGGRRACVVRDDRSLLCWGATADGHDILDGPEVMDVAEEIVGVTVAHSHTCAWGIGAAWCWGDNSEGQLGALRTEPPVRVPDVGRIQRMSASEISTCFHNREGVTACFGSIYGERTAIAVEGPVRAIFARQEQVCVQTDRGLECTTSREGPPSVSWVDGSSGVAQASFGTGHFCVKSEAGAVRCAGAGWAGALGDGDGYRDEPSRVRF